MSALDRKQHTFVSEFDAELNGWASMFCGHLDSQADANVLIRLEYELQAALFCDIGQAWPYLDAVCFSRR